MKLTWAVASTVTWLLVQNGQAFAATLPTALPSDDTSPSAANNSPGPTTPVDRGEPRAPKAAGKEQVQIGAIGGVGFPRPLSIEGLMKIERTVALGLEYSVLPTTNIGGVDFKASAVAGDLRVFPFAGPFFFGTRLGRQHFEASTSLTIASYGTVHGDTTTDTWFVNPRLGFLHTWSSGFTLGLEGGLQIPLSHTTANKVPDGVTVPTSITRVSDLFGASVLPTVSLLQAGMMF